MDAWAIIPVKPLPLGKSRLAGVLDPAARTALNRRLFERVFARARDTIGIGRIVVVSADEAVLAWTSGSGAHALREPGSGLNDALEHASRYAAERGAEAVIVLPSDLPEIERDDIAALEDALGPPPACAIAPDSAEKGTNALALRPPAAGLFRFGPQSFALHRDAARALGYGVRVVCRAGLAQDLDTPEGYHHWIQKPGATA